MAALQFYNSLTREKETFSSIIPGKVGMYVCGPTVSGESHLGHARPFITFDIVYRYLKHLGYHVRYVRNITDAGHFEEEGRESEDKISKKAVLEKLEPMELVQKYTNLFHWAMRAFNNLEPSIEPTATGHIVEQIVMIEKIIQDGYAYVVNGSVYFDVEKYHKDFGAKGMQYGILSGRVIEEQLETTRELESQEEKRNKTDFALWKNAAPEHIMRWQSPWGIGFPGWHIECSAMSTKYLGEEFDIHGGGMDLQFPHHECEIAQSAVCNHKIPARFWLHNNMITINGKKMGKSYNNVIKLSELFAGTHEILTQGYSPMTVRFFILQTHYRSTLDFSNEALQAAEKGLKRIWEAFSYLRKIEIEKKDTSATDTDLENKVQDVLNGLENDMNDDLNTAKVLAGLFELVPVINSIKDGKINRSALSSKTLEFLQRQFNTYLVDIFGLTDESTHDDDKLTAVLQLIGEIRKDARSRKDFATSDKIRNQLLAAGIQLKDEKDGGMSWEL
ncbi:MAG: cysteine--tRNA ligase, partial [Chitinophagia bacterium]|nr:cysteine--tRNA ligase [Chitinophagia bacterium]